MGCIKGELELSMLLQNEIEKLNKPEEDKLMPLKKRFQVNQELFLKEIDKIGDGRDESMQEFRYIKTLDNNKKTNHILPYQKLIAIIFLGYAVFFIFNYFLFFSIFSFLRERSGLVWRRLQVCSALDGSKSWTISNF